MSSLANSPRRDSDVVDAASYSVGSSSREGGARLLVALTNSDTKKALASAALARKGLAALSEKYQKQVEALWEQANTEALSHLTIVLRNNPHKTKAAILARPDVQSALRYPYEQAAQQSEEIVRKAWKAGEAEAVKMVKGEFKLLKAAWAGHEVDETLLDSLVGDLYANAEAMRERLGEALTNPGSKGVAASLNGLASNARLRASYTVSTAVWGVSTEVRDSAIDKAGLNKMWVAVLDEKTCSHCKALNGMILAPGKQFPINAGKTALKAYRGILLGPPRHPSCRCQLIPTKLKKTK